MPHPLVVHVRRVHDVYIGRPSKWGNPFVTGKDGTCEDVIRKYDAWIRKNPYMMRLCRAELRGKILGCYCAPLACHGDVLARIANAPSARRLTTSVDRQSRPLQSLPGDSV